LIAAALGLLLAAPAFAQGASPWENAVSVLQQAFTSTIARGLSLVAIVVSSLTFAFGESGSKRVLAGVLFGVGMAIAAVNFKNPCIQRYMLDNVADLFRPSTNPANWRSRRGEILKFVPSYRRER